MSKLDSHFFDIGRFDRISYGKRGSVDTVIVENNNAKAEISLFGGQVLSYIPREDNRERLWISPKAIFDGVTPIRGGIPICWPWFGDDHQLGHELLPSHGFVRNQQWNIMSIDETNNSTVINFTPNCLRRPYFKHDVTLNLTVEIGKTLTVKLTTLNRGNQAVPISFALHTYFAINNLDHVVIKGLEGKYKDKTNNWKEGHTPAEYRINGETDRIHDCRGNRIEAIDELTQKSTIQFHSEGHDSIVVWNPGRKLSESMKDMADDSYKNMLCIETAMLQTRSINEQSKMVMIKEIQ